MNQSIEGSLVKFLYECISNWLKLAKEYNCIYNEVNQLEEKVSSLKSYSAIDHFGMVKFLNLFEHTFYSLDQKIQLHMKKLDTVKRNFSQLVEISEKKLFSITNTMQLYSQANNNVLPGLCGESLTFLMMKAEAMQNCLFKQEFYFQRNGKCSEPLKFLNEELAHEVQTLFDIFRKNAWMPFIPSDIKPKNKTKVIPPSNFLFKCIKDSAINIKSRMKNEFSSQELQVHIEKMFNKGGKKEDEGSLWFNNALKRASK